VGVTEEEGMVAEEEEEEEEILFLPMISWLANSS